MFLNSNCFFNSNYLLLSDTLHTFHVVDKRCTEPGDCNWKTNFSTVYRLLYICGNYQGSDGELRSLVLCLQQHHDTLTCRKTTHRGQNVTECHFDFPRPLCEETHLKSHNHPGNRSRCYLLKRSVGEENINPYNKHLLIQSAECPC